MRLIYQPEDAPRQEWSLRLTNLLSPEAEAIEESGGNAWRSYDEFTLRLDEGLLKARRALLWVLLRRSDPRLRFSDLVVRASEIDLDFDDEQVADLRRRAADESLTQEERDLARGMLEASGRTVETEEPGKDEPGDSATDSPSPTQD